MKKKLYLTRTVKVACFLLAIMFSTAFLQHYVLRRMDHNSTRLDGYYLEDKDSLDVVLIGASDVYTSFSSCRAYDKFGFTSYPYATEAMTAGGIKAALKEVLRTQNPKLILIEINPYLYGTANNEKKEVNLHRLLDNMPMSANKIEAVSNNTPNENRAEYYMPIMKYHSIWRDYPKPARRAVSALKQDARGYSYLKGYRTTTNVYESPYKILNRSAINESKAYPLNANLEAKLRDLLEFCKEKKLDNVAFVRVPHLIYKKTYDRVRRSNTAGQIINSYGYDYLNLEREWNKIGIDIQKDFYNVEHMNIYGAVKFTDYLGNLLQTEYNIGSSELTDTQKTQWDNAAISFNRLYRYCDDLIQQGKQVKLEEDINTLKAIDKY